MILNPSHTNPYQASQSIKEHYPIKSTGFDPNLVMSQINHQSSSMGYSIPTSLC